MLRRIPALQGGNLPPDYFNRPEIYTDCLTFLTKMDTVLDSAMNQTYSMKVNKQLIENIQDEIMKKKQLIESMRKTGKLTNEAYASALQKGIDRDQLLMDVFMKNGMQKMADLMNCRLRMGILELNSLQNSTGQVQPTQPQTKVQPQPQPQPQPAQQQSTKPQPQPAQQLPSHIKQYDLSTFALTVIRILLSLL